MKSKSWRTAIRRKDISAPARYLWAYGHINAEKDTLDYGCGHGKDIWCLKTQMGCRIWGYDPYLYCAVENLNRKYDTILCTYVLNVVDRKTRASIVEHIKKLLKPGGKAYITVRRDIKKEGWTSRQTQQFNVDLPYRKIKENSKFCIYEINK